MVTPIALIPKNVNGIKKRAINGTIQLLVPTAVIREHLKDFTKAGKPIHHNARINHPMLDIVNMYNAEIRGLYNYYCLATDVSRKIGRFRHYHYGNLLKTIARKEKRTVRQIIDKYGIEIKRKDGKGTRKIIGARYETQKGTKIMIYFNDSLKTHKQPMNDTDRLIIPTNPKSQLEKRLNAKQCEYCETMIKSKSTM